MYNINIIYYSKLLSFVKILKRFIFYKYYILFVYILLPMSNGYELLYSSYNVSIILLLIKTIQILICLMDSGHDIHNISIML